MAKWVLWFSLIVLTGCSGAIATEAPPQVITATPLRVALAQFPTATAETGGVPTPIPTNTPEVCEDSSDSDLLRYDINANLSWDTHFVDVEQTITYRNTHQDTLDKIVFQAEPNRIIGVLSISGVLRDNSTLIGSVDLDAIRLTIPLSQPLRPNCTIKLEIDYRLKLPPIRETENGRWGYLGYSENQVNLGHWLMGLATYTGSGEWYVPPASNVGEQTIALAADYNVNLTVSGTPVGLQVAGPGTKTRISDGEWQFELNSSRDFALSLSDRFQKLNSSINGVAVELYFNPQQQDLNAASQAIEAATRALLLFTDLFGPYPYERLVIVEGDFPDGMEFTGITFVSEAWFRVWKGIENDWLTLITVHEVAHQWWYAIIGNDQANAPYLDEALATYSEYLYFEEYFPEHMNWWWQFRINTYDSNRPVDSKVYNFNASRPYINAVYLRGVKMIDEIRSTLGDDTFFEWLQRYVEDNTGQVANPQTFWGSLEPDDYAALASVRETYLQSPDVLLGQQVQVLD